MRISKRILQIIFALMMGSGASAASPASFTYEGVLTDSNGTPVDLSGRTITFSIINGSNCVIYSESSTASGDANGNIIQVVGTGTPTTGTFNAALFNSSLLGSGGCTVSASEPRYLYVAVPSLSLSATVNLTSVPYALEATAVGGYAANSILRTDSSVASVTPLNNTQYTKLTELIAGSSTQYVQQGSPVFSSQPQYSGTPSGPNDLTNRGYVDSAINTAVTTGLPNVGTPGTYFKVVTDNKGRVTTGATTLTDADIPHLTSAGKVDGAAITAGTIGGSTGINTSGNLITSGTVSAITSSANQLRVWNATKYVEFTSPSLNNNVSFKLPAADGSAGQVLKTDGFGNLSWVSPSSGSVTSVGASPPLSSSGGSNPSISISQANSTTDGYLSSTDWNTFNNKLGTGTAFSGDVTGAYNSTSIAKIQGSPIYISSPSLGNFLRYNGSAWVNTSLIASQIPSLDASKISTGTLPVSLGGTGSTTALTNNKVMVSSGGAIVEGNGFGSTKAGNTFVTRDPSGNFAAGIGTFDSLKLNGSTNGTLTLTVPPNFSNYSLSFPSADGSSGQFLMTDGSGNLTWGTSAAPGNASYAAKGIVQFNTDAATSGISMSSGVATVNFGTGANQIVKLDGSSRLPAVDGSQLTSLSVAQITAGTLPIYRGGTGQTTKTAAFDALSPNSIKGDITIFNGTNNVSLPLGGNGQVLTADSSQATGVKWSNASTGTVTNVTAGAGLTGGTITSTGTLSVDVGTSANQIVQLDGSGHLPGVDGSQLTNLSAAQISAGTLPVNHGGTGAGSFSSNQLVGTNGTGTVLQSVTCAQNKVLSFDASGSYGCYSLSSIANGTYFANGGNTFGTNAILGSNDNYTLGFKTNGNVAMTIDTSGNIGIGTLPSSSKLDVKGAIRLTGGNSGYAGFQPAADAGNTIWTLPVSDGGNGQFLQTDGSGHLTWATSAAPGDAGYTGTKGIVAFDTDPTTSGISVSSGIAKLSNTTVIAGAYGTAAKIPSIAVNAQGRITSANEISIAIPPSQITQGSANPGEVLKWNGSAWSPAADNTGTSPGDATYAVKGLVQADTNASTSGLNLSLGVISVNSGTGANQIVQLDGSSKLPAVDGSQLTNLKAAQITAGTLPVSLGGTGQSSYSDGQLLIGNSVGNTLTKSTLTAGSGITIANGNGSITISAAGSGGTVTSVGVSVPNYMTSSGGPITTSGTIALGFGSQVAKTIFAAPQATSGLPSFRLLNIADIQSSVSGNFLTGSSCTSGQALAYNSVTDTISCGNLIPSVANNATLLNTKIWVGDASNKAQEVAISGDASLSSTGALTLANSGVTASTYKSVTVDIKGRVTSGTNPTTLSGFGITDAVQNTAGVPSISAGTQASRPGVGVTGAIFVATDTFRTYRDNGTSWDQLNVNASDLSTGTLPIGRLPAFTGDVTSVAGSNSLTLNTVPLTKGGTGLSAAGTANQILGMNGAGNGAEFKTINAGSGVTVSHSANSITISASGSGLTSLNGASNSTQSFGSPGTSGTSPNWSTDTGTGVHTLNIPLANSAGVSAGLISNSEYSSFNSKLGTSTTFGGDVGGTYNNISVNQIKGYPVSVTGLQSGNFLKYNGTGWVPANIDASVDLNGTLPINRGGTNNGSLSTSAGGVLYTDGTKFQNTGSGSAGQALISNGLSAPNFGILGIAGGGTGQYTYTGNGIIMANAGGSGFTSGKTCSPSEVLRWDSTTWSCAPGNFFLQGGNSFNGPAFLGTGDGNDLNLQTNGTTRMTVTSAGKVGIGTTTPSYPLSVTVTGSTADMALASYTSTASSGSSIYFRKWNNSLGSGDTSTTSASPIALGGLEFQGIYYSGSNSYFTPGARILASQTGTSNISGVPAKLDFQTSGGSLTSTRMTIDSAGQIWMGGGIGSIPGTANNGTLFVGSTGPKIPLVLYNDSNSGIESIDFWGSNAGTPTLQFSLGYANPGAGGYAYINSNAGSNIQFQLTNSTKMTLNSYGLGVGSSGTLASSTYALEVTGAIHSSGCIYANSGSPLGTGCASDQRIKKDVKPFSLGLDALLGIKPVNYKYNGLAGFEEDGKEQLGVIAQELEKAAPQLVGKREVLLHSDDKEKTEIKVVNYSAFTFVLINAVKELYHQWFNDSESLHQELASKDQRIQSLETDNALLKAEAKRQREENAAIKAYLCSKDQQASICK